MQNNQNIYDALSRIVKSRMKNTQADDMVLLALAVWHEGFVPETAWAQKLDHESKHVVGYLAEFLAAFNLN